jgi:4-amino-4-deoxy-L-arabinose transferase-like glycosyltransferase
MNAQGSFGVLFVLGLSLALLWAVARSLPPDLQRRTRQCILAVVAAAILGKLLIAAGWYVLAGHCLDDVWVDTGSYDWAGRQLAQAFSRGVFQTADVVRIESPGFPLFVGAVYLLFGPSQWMVSLLLNVANVVAALLMWDVARRLFGVRIGLVCLVLNLIYPAYIHYSHFILKDSLVMLMVVVVIWLAVRCSGSMSTVRTLLPLAGLLAGLALLRPQLALPLAILVAVQLVSGVRQRRTETALTMVVLISGFAFWTTRYQPAAPSPLEVLAGIQSPVSAVHTDTPDFLKAASLRDVPDVMRRIASHPTAFVIHAGETMILTFWGPNHFYSRSSFSLTPAWLTLGGLFTIALMPMVGYGYLWSLRHSARHAFLPLAFVAFVAVSLIFLGNVHRWGLPMMPTVMMFGAVGCCHFRAKIRPYYPAYIAGLVTLAASNISVGTGAPQVGMFLTGAFVMTLAVAVCWSHLRSRSTALVRSR